MVFVWHPIIIFNCARGNIIKQQNVEASYKISSCIMILRQTIILNRISDMSNFHGNVGIHLK